MTQIRTTQELSQILAQEREACLRGDRLNLTTVTYFNPVVDPFLNVEGIQKFRAFCDFREAVHQYQRDHKISGLLWRTFTVKGQSLDYPELDENLVALPADLLTLAAHKGRVIDFWWQVTQGMDWYLQMDKHTPHQPILAPEVQSRAERAAWASLHKLDYAQALEITLQLGWGNPKEALYQKYWPLSGCYFIHAVGSGQFPQSAYY